jgi:hypothetical protein
MRFDMNKLILAGLITFSGVLHAQALEYGDVYAPEAIKKLLTTSYPQFKNPNCLKDYLATSNHRDRLPDGGKIRSVNVCSEGVFLRFNIRYNQMGGSAGSMASINWIVYCDLKKPVSRANCNENN